MADIQSYRRTIPVSKPMAELLCAALVFTAASSSPAARDPELENGLTVYRDALILMRRAAHREKEGRDEEALVIYERLLEKLMKFKRDNPIWNNDVTNRKIEECSRRIKKLARSLDMVRFRDSYMKRSAFNRLMEEARTLEKDEVSNRRGTTATISQKEAEKQSSADEADLVGETAPTRSWNIPLSARRPQIETTLDPVVRAENAEKALLAARELRAQGREKDALVLLEDALKIFPELPAAYLERADICLSQKSYERAIEDYRMSISLGEAGIEAHYGLGTAYEKLAEKLESEGEQNKASEKYRDAIAEYKEAVWQNHDYSPAYYSLGCVYSRLGKREDAIYYFKKTLGSEAHGSELARRARYNIRLLGGY